jgi:mono/diheme cytochrome c family protein
MIAWRATTTMFWFVSATTLLAASIAVVSNAAGDPAANAEARSSQQDEASLDSQSSPPANSSQSETPVATATATASEANDKENIDGKLAKSRIKQGKYLVHHVAQCIQCHTPRNATGALIESRSLTGAPIPLVGPAYAQPWAAESAWIAGLGSYDEAYVHYLLTHGRKPDGSQPKRPMPSFQMTDADATAVIAYLRSL